MTGGVCGLSTRVMSPRCPDEQQPALVEDVLVAVREGFGERWCVEVFSFGGRSDLGSMCWQGFCSLDVFRDYVRLVELRGCGCHSALC
jgi:hypothetical protein